MNILIIILIFLAIIIVSTFIICFNKLNLTFKVAITTIFLGIFCLILAFLPFGFFSKDITNNINSTLIGFGTGLILTAITITFIQYFLDQQKIKIKEEIEKKQERDDLIKLDRIMTILISNYKLAFKSMTIPMEKRTSQLSKDIEININFNFKDMIDLYKNSLISDHYIFEMPVELFFEEEKKLKDCIKFIIEKTDLKYHPSFLKLFLSFLEVSLAKNLEHPIMKNLTVKRGKTNLLNMIEEKILLYSNDLIDNAFQKKIKIESYMIPYLHLYRLLKIEGKLIIEYQNEIEKIKNLEEGN